MWFSKIIPVLLVVFFSYSCRSRAPTSDSKAEPYARRILGEGQDFQAQTLNRDLMKNSFESRRREGWRILKEAVRPVETAMEAGSTGSGIRTVPLFQTWYDAKEFAIMVRYLYKCKLSPEERTAVKDPTSRFVIPEERAKEVLRSQVKMKLPSTWSDGRFLQVLGQLKRKNDLAGLNGVEGTGVSLFSPALLRHYLENLSFVYHCTASSQPGQEPDQFAQCFSKALPENAVAVKTTFNRMKTGAAVFDTSAAGLAAVLGSIGPDKSNWAAAKPPVAAFETPESLEKIYNVNFRQAEQDYGTFLLTGLHVTTREIPEWMWVSMWWSMAPKQDFGSDRPTDFTRGIDPAFGNYKMCVVADFDERDSSVLTAPAVPGRGAVADLKAAQLAAHSFTGKQSWCSNPFIEHMPQGAKSNCIGCHQFAGPDGLEIPDSNHPPVLEKKTNRFPGDFLASFHGGMRDDFQGIVQETISEVDGEGADSEIQECQLDQ